MAQNTFRHRAPQPPARAGLPLFHISEPVQRWLDVYWHKLRLPSDQANYLAMTQDRGEFARWTGRRLASLTLGCYCYLPLHANEVPGRSGADELAGLPVPHFIHDYPEAAASATLTAPATTSRWQLRLPGFEATETRDAMADTAEDETLAEFEDPIEVAGLAYDYRHLIFIEPGMSELGLEVTVAHELIHLADRVSGKPRRHRCHGHDAISVDEARLTGRDPELLRAQLREETERREAELRRARPIRYIYTCPVCQKEYPRVRRFANPISCGDCDNRFNPAFELTLRVLAKGEAFDG